MSWTTLCLLPPSHALSVGMAGEAQAAGAAGLVYIRVGETGSIDAAKPVKAGLSEQQSQAILASTCAQPVTPRPCVKHSHLQAYLNDVGLPQDNVGLSGRAPLSSRCRPFLPAPLPSQCIPANGLLRTSVHQEMLPNGSYYSWFQSKVSAVCVAGGSVAHSSWSASCGAQVLGQGQTVSSGQPGRSGPQQAQPVVGHRRDCLSSLHANQIVLTLAQAQDAAVLCCYLPSCLVVFTSFHSCSLHHRHAVSDLHLSELPRFVNLLHCRLPPV